MELQIILNSNPWFSAVTDYSLQLARFVSAKKNTKVIYCAPAGSIALKKKQISVRYKPMQSRFFHSHSPVFLQHGMHWVSWSKTTDLQSSGSLKGVSTLFAHCTEL